MEKEISKGEFKLFKEYIYNRTGINLTEHKITLLKARLNKRLRALGLTSFKKYYEFLIHNEDEYTDFVNAISTNVTSFFREEKQWVFLKKEIHNIKAHGGGKLRIW
jgi:chemotaxis protein methyltransferase CheR